MRQKVMGLMAGLICLIGLAVPSASAAILCRQLDGHAVCILKITRSAKHHWEYRATLSIDGAPQPPAVYNCRSRQRIRQDGQPAPMEAGGKLICRYFSK
ncbi:MAG: hypothetical protein F6J97_22340 [Leptolyngbya sp. SIO4C1]|nr:hypothetical protein [Leptolyngbya sp. SIO4C1]